MNEYLDAGDCRDTVFYSNTSARVVPICLDISNRALSKVFEHRNFAARYPKEAINIAHC